MAAKKILIAEDDVSTSIMLSEFLSSRGYNVETAGNGREALDKYMANPAQIVITDIEMPVMDGNEFIDNLISLEMPPVIFVTTSHKNSELIIDIMKKGVYDYIIKPVDMSDLLLKLTRAFKAYEMKLAFEISQREKVIRLESNLDWYRFEEKVKTRDKRAMGDNLFESLLTSFNQGAGFGSLVSLMGVITSTAVKDGEDYRIDGELFDVVKNNVALAEKALQTFAEISKITTAQYLPEKISLADFYDEITAEIAKFESLLALRKHRVIRSDKKGFFSDMFIEIHRENFMKAFHEIIINALKFSSAGSDIVILFQTHANTFTLSVFNDIPADNKGHNGIPMGYENLVFEPFYRLSKMVFEEYNTLDYGLGLTLAEKIISKHEGRIAIHNTTDQSDLKVKPKIKVECEIALPIVI
jgi:CheY-like chemotaxis protein